MNLAVNESQKNNVLLHIINELTNSYEINLTTREKQCIQYIIAGNSSKLVARQLGISYRTVDLHVAHILEKLSIHSKNELFSKFFFMIIEKYILPLNKESFV